MPVEFVSATCLPVRAAEDAHFKQGQAVIISLYGPKGGTRIAEALSVEQAKSLMNELALALDKLQGTNNARR